MTDTLDGIHEQLLIARCQVGEAAAFVEIVDRYQARLGYFLRKLVGRTSSVDDLLQDVWLDAYRSLGALADPAAFPAWLYRIARNRAYRELRRSRRVTSTDAVDDVVAPEVEVEFSPEDIQLVHECLDELSDEHREALVLRFLEEMSYDDIASVMGCSVGTVRSRLHYAKLSLRSEINRRRRP